MADVLLGALGGVVVGVVVTLATARLTSKAPALSSAPSAGAPFGAVPCTPGAPTEPTPGSPLEPAASGAVSPDAGRKRARERIAARLEAGTASTDEVRFLKALCQSEDDNACVARANAVLSPGNAAPAEPATSGGATDQALSEEKRKRAKTALSTKVDAGKASTSEIQMLKALCQADNDKACVARANAALNKSLDTR